jgi:hypothetical protein
MRLSESKCINYLQFEKFEWVPEDRSRCVEGRPGLELIIDSILLELVHILMVSNSMHICLK